MKLKHLSILFFLSASALTGCSSTNDTNKLDVTPPPTPTNLKIALIGNGAVSLTWDPVSDKGLTGYYVYWLGEAAVDTLNANKRYVQPNNITLSGLDYDTLYYFAVSAIDDSGNESSLSVQKSGKPSNTTSPDPPSGVDIAAENIDYPKITVYWEKNVEPDIDHYNIYRTLNPADLGDSTSFVISVTKEQFYDINVDVGVIYHYQVTAVDKGNWESPPSTTASDYVLQHIELLSPHDHEYVSATPTFLWQSVNGANKYKFILMTSKIGGELWTIEVDKQTTQLTYTGRARLISGNPYYWQVGAISRREINSVSDVYSFVVRAQ